MIPYKITVAYDGTQYTGWQVQKSAMSVAGILQKRFFDAFKKPIKLVGASRTDAGVHANGQVARFETNLSVQPSVLIRVWNQHLPGDILVCDIEPCDYTFNPRYNACRKIYYYQFFLERPHPFHARFGYYMPYALDIKKFEKCLEVFKGTHDFRSFCTGDYESTMRTIDYFSLRFNDQIGGYQIEIAGRSFLRYMIRRIIGACFKIASFDLPILYLKEALERRDPRQLLPTAPAKGLILHKILY